jgi:hypothetical protein
MLSLHLVDCFMKIIGNGLCILKVLGYSYYKIRLLGFCLRLILLWCGYRYFSIDNNLKKYLTFII